MTSAKREKFKLLVLREKPPSLDGFILGVCHFYLNDKIAKQYIEEFEEAQEESQELLGMMQKKVKDLMIRYGSEMGKRAMFTYNIGVKAKENKASTSLKRAVEFYNECLRVMDKL